MNRLASLLWGAAYAGHLAPGFQRRLSLVQDAEREVHAERLLGSIGRSQGLVGSHEIPELLLSATVEIVPVARDEGAAPLSGPFASLRQPDSIGCDGPRRWLG